MELDALQGAISSMFDAMNAGFFSRSFDLNVDIPQSVVFFLSQFDAIFTLNQDLLLGHGYLVTNLSTGPYRNWSGHELPGMQLKQGEEVDTAHSWSRNHWVPITAPYAANPTCQPLFKLHGSSNWVDADSIPLLVIGGNKTRQLKHNAILSWYAKKFGEYLRAGDTRLMTIGYGFRDGHINDAIKFAVERSGLRFFNISPEGASQARAMNPTRQPGAITDPSTDLEPMFEKGIVGTSRRSLSEIFGRGSSIEHAKIMRFFAP